jgi:hypothetical protein
MKNAHTKLEQYTAKCDEIFLSEHLSALIKEATKNVKQIKSKKLYTVAVSSL